MNSNIKHRNFSYSEWRRGKALWSHGNPIKGRCQPERAIEQ